MKMSEDKIKITPAKGRPMLHWVGKNPLDYVKGFPAQLVELFDPLNNAKIPEVPSYEDLKDNWHNLLFHGDNKDVLATLLEKGFRGKIDLIYIDPPFRSGADYVRKVELRGLKNLGWIEEGTSSILQQTMYFDIWNNDNYLQFMYERLMLLKELLSENGNIFIHLDQAVGHYVKVIADEIFGDNFLGEIVWYRYNKIPDKTKKLFFKMHDTILHYAKNRREHFFQSILSPTEKKIKRKKMKKIEGRIATIDENIEYMQELLLTRSVIDFIPDINVGSSKERVGFKTQKPEELLNIIISSCCPKNSIVLDCFIGSGTTARVAQKLGRRWIGCDINKGAIQLASKSLQKIINEQIKKEETKYSTFAIYRVNDYDLKILQTEAIELAVQHIGIQRTRTDPFFDGYLGKSLVKITDFNHPLTLLDLQLIQNELNIRREEDRNITIVCFGKELSVDPWIEEWNKKHPVNKIHIIELKTDKKYGSFLIRKPDEAKVKIERIDKTKANAIIENFISPTIVERLNMDNRLFKVKIPDFRCMIDTVLIDTNYDGKVFHIVYSDVPKKKDDLVRGGYEIEIPRSKTKIAVKIIDMLGEEVLVAEEV
ncbi:MAG: site-specific DNA-methyltransferase [Candidatus Methanolliviera hydrocarbonicum]|uniref:Site-specific DNA-methyltransferase n=1 Tax=Candidatus Methanolliviera hydrocarbonicum TaxID=2491085 RepID=A0A520KZ15_9EURY|nr:MAG: site-specific DNA-methyltransferase [Candidatus Methanolliviera hydrocarbonicum]